MGKAADHGQGNILPNGGNAGSEGEGKAKGKGKNQQLAGPVQARIQDAVAQWKKLQFDEVEETTIQGEKDRIQWKKLHFDEVEEAMMQGEKDGDEGKEG